MVMFINRNFHHVSMNMKGCIGYKFIYIHVCILSLFIMAMEYIIDNLLFGFDTSKQLLQLRYMIYISCSATTYQNSF